MHTIPKHRKHPLKEEVQNLGLCLWQLREMLGGSPSEAKLSRYFNGIDKLPSELEHRLRHIISETKGFKNN